MKESLIKYFNKEFREFRVEFVDFGMLYPYESPGIILERNGIAREKIHDGIDDIGFNTTGDEVIYHLILTKIQKFIDKGINFRYDINVDIESHIPEYGAYPGNKGSRGPTIFRLEVKLNINTIPENMLKSLLGISKYNL